MTFWQAYWKLTVTTSKGLVFFAGMAAYGYVAGEFMHNRLWLTVLMLTAAIAMALALAARQLSRRA